MRCKSVVLCALLWAAIFKGVFASPPTIVSLQTNRALTWMAEITNGITIVEKSTTLLPGSWSPFYYDSGFYARTSSYPYPYFVDVPLAMPRTTLLPSSTNSAAFFRLAMQTNAPDPSLLLHFTFDNDFVHNRVVLDSSGHNNHGLAYGRPGYPTNWPSATVGPDGSQAAEFHYYRDGWGDYGTSGDYIGIPTITDFTNVPQATISFWCHYYADPLGCDCNSTPMQAGMGVGAGSGCGAGSGAGAGDGAG